MKTTIQKLWISIAMLCLSLQASASDFEVNGIQYDITSFTELTVTASSISEDVTGDVTIPSTVTFKGKVLAVVAIGRYFAYGNNKITSITIGDGVKEIGDNAFENRSNLSRVTIPESVTRIGEEAFENCSKLEKVEALGVNTIEASAFANCENLTSCVFKSLEEIGEKAFANCGIVSIDLPSTVTTIGKGAFYQCNKLVSFNIPNNVKEIEEDIIGNCESLKELTIGNGIDELPPISQNCPNLEKVRIEDSEKKLLIKGRYGDRYAVPSIFSGCGLKEVYIGRDLKANEWTYKKNDNRYYYITVAPFSGFGISKVVIGPYVTSIDMSYGKRSYYKHAFEDCKELTEVIFQSSVVKEIPKEAFYGCSNLQKVKLSNSVQRIEEWAFSYCTNLQKIKLPNSVQRIEDEAFRGCKSLSIIDLGENLEYIGQRNFSECNQLLTINVHSPNPPTCKSDFSSQSYINTIVNVPSGSLSLYQNTWPWCDFWNLKEDNHLSAGIDNASTTTNAEELTRYTINGQKISAPSKGLNIIRYNDGSVKKVVVQ